MDAKLSPVDLPLTAPLPERMAAAPPDVAGPVSSAAAPAKDLLASTDASPFDRLTDLLIVGGPVVWILLAMSSVALAIVLLKVWQFRALGLGRPAVTDHALRLWRAGQPLAAIEATVAARQPLSRLLHTAMTEMRAGTGAVDVELLREELARMALNTLEQLRSHMRALEVIASLSPLLGLFGTVLGMIEAFRQMELAGNQVDPGVLSGGIWVALLTTAVGLAVAMPTVMTHSWLERRIDRFRHRIEDNLTQVFTHPVDAEEHASGQLVKFGKRHAPA